jgi:uncharacterized protein
MQAAQVVALLHEYHQELDRFGVRRCGIFGSFARDTAIHPQSDVDILVAFEPDQKTFDNFIHLSFFLEDLFGRTVDFITVEWRCCINKELRRDSVMVSLNRQTQTQGHETAISRPQLERV